MKTHAAVDSSFVRRGLVGTVAVCLLVFAQPAAARTSLADLLARLEALEQEVTVLKEENTALKSCLRVDETNRAVVVEDCNLHVRNGQGATDSINGRGNLIVGYDAARSVGSNKTGSHNVVIGDRHNYTRFGGLVTGLENAITGDWASVSGGKENAASGEASSVSGGEFNNARGEVSSVSGGLGHTASGSVSSVSGGWYNTASGNSSSVSGGANNRASGQVSSVSGGQNRSVPETYNWRAGGYFQAR